MSNFTASLKILKGYQFLLFLLNKDFVLSNVAKLLFSSWNNRDLKKPHLKYTFKKKGKKRGYSFVSIKLNTDTYKHPVRHTEPLVPCIPVHTTFSLMNSRKVNFPCLTRINILKVFPFPFSLSAHLSVTAFAPPTNDPLEENFALTSIPII